MPNGTCGTLGQYKSGCRCLACRRANATYVKEWRSRPAQLRKQAELEKRDRNARIMGMRMREVEANVQRILAGLVSTPPQQWEIEKAIREERDVLKAENAELRARIAQFEAELDGMIDAAVDHEARGGTSSILRKPRYGGRPRKVKPVKVARKRQPRTVVKVCSSFKL